MNTIIIQGSSNPEGNTNSIINHLKKVITADSIDLAHKNILPFDYEFKNQHDDFSITMHHILDNYDCIIFATPVYWYTMSGIMKNFFDRFTDGLLHDHTLSKKFKNKKMGVIACGSSKDEIEAFFIPFQKTAQYLNMTYIGDVHLWINTNHQIDIDAQQRINAFCKLIH